MGEATPLPERRCIAEGPYRYLLAEGPTFGALCWVMLNPSTADASQDDPTIRMVRGFTARAGYDSWVVVNLYAWRATDPGALRAAIRRGDDAIGPRWTETFGLTVGTAGAIVLAWGANADHPSCRDHTRDVRAWVRKAPAPVYRIGPLLQSGQPRHPLMAPYAMGLVPYPTDGG